MSVVLGGERFFHRRKGSKRHDGCEEEGRFGMLRLECSAGMFFGRNCLGLVQSSPNGVLIGCCAEIGGRRQHHHGQRLVRRGELFA
jgi:hypothetical protein